jgi:hypothetical protein
MKVPTWDEIIDRTEEDLRAERFLERCGLRLKVERTGKERYQATIRRRYRTFALTLAADDGRAPSAYGVLAAVILRAAMQTDFARRAHRFFTKDELQALEKVL